MRHIRFCFASALSAFALLLSVHAAAQATCTLSTTNRTVTICTPANGATVSTTFHVNAGTTDTATVQYMQVYVNSKLYATQYRKFLDANITVPAGTHENLTVQAKDASGFMKKTYYINVTAGSTYKISPLNPTVSEGATQQFTASSASTWTASCGSISASGLFTAPLKQTSCTITGKASDGSGHTASTLANISSPITITPSSATTKVGQTQTFTANVAVTWTASCGTIDSTGLFTAPATAQSCTITATAASGTPYTASAIDTVTSTTSASLNYTTWKNDNARDGLNSKETILTTANVNASTFGKLFSTPVDGRLWAQPLYMSGVTIGGAKHNVVYVATANDSVYAIDGDSGAQLWKVSLLTGGETPGSATTLHSSVQPQIGITGTPVIDPSTGTLYAVTQSGLSGTFFHRLHALDITNGKERFGAPVVINSGGWDSSQHLQRPGLTLANGTIYVAFSSNEDVLPYHGWVFGYSADTLNQVAVWNVTPGGNAGGIWMGGGGIAADAGGDLYLTTGNGDWSGATEYGQSAVRLSPTLGVVDYFTPIAHASESGADKDLGSGGVLLLPTNTGAHPHEAIVCSKLDLIYVLDRDHMGELGSGSDNVVQQVSGQLGATSGVQYTDRCFSTAAFWNNNLYFIGNNDAVKQFSYNPSNGLMSTTPTHKNTYAFQFPGGQPVVSSNGNSNAIVWSIDWKTGTLRAYDATNVSNSLYVSPTLGTGIKFTVPTVVNGHVYVGLGSNVVGMGLTGSSGSCSPPASAGVHVCAPTAGGSYTSPVPVKAAGTGASGSVSRMEVWSDGTKIGNFAGNQVNTSVSLAVGSHAITVIEVDSTGAFIKSSPISITVH
jgi:hypothetical protein